MSFSRAFCGAAVRGEGQKGIEVTFQPGGVGSAPARARNHPKERDGREPDRAGADTAERAAPVGADLPVLVAATPGPGRGVVRPAHAHRRGDLRVNKAFLFDGWKLTAYGEVINLLNHTNTRYTGLDGVNLRTGRVFLERHALPILPSVGLTVEF